jgi:hypothetical protein
VHDDALLGTTLAEARINRTGMAIAGSSLRGMVFVGPYRRRQGGRRCGGIAEPDGAVRDTVADGGEESESMLGLTTTPALAQRGHALPAAAA